MSDDEELIDVIVVGAGISGLYAAYRIKQKAPHLKVLVLEAKGTYRPPEHHANHLLSLKIVWVVER